MKRNLFLFMLLSFLFCLCAAGCASKKYVNRGFGKVDRTISSLEESVETNQTRINENERYIKDHEGRILNLSEETKAAVTRIDSVEKMAMGKLLYQVTLDNDKVKFQFGIATLTDSAISILDEMVDVLIRENRNIFLEIQGHTDSSGDENYNYQLGLGRAESVRRYLSTRGIPLHRMATISHGESKPVADNSTSEGRSKNRRVVILILE